MKKCYLEPIICKLGFRDKPEYVLTSFYHHEFLYLETNDGNIILPNEIWWTKEDLRDDLNNGCFHNTVFQNMFFENLIINKNSKNVTIEVIENSAVKSQLLDLAEDPDCLSTKNDILDILSQEPIEFFVCNGIENEKEKLLKKYKMQFGLPITASKPHLYYTMLDSGIFTYQQISDIFKEERQAIYVAVSYFRRKVLPRLKA